MLKEYHPDKVFWPNNNRVAVMLTFDFQLVGWAKANARPFQWRGLSYAVPTRFSARLALTLDTWAPASADAPAGEGASAPWL